MLEIKHKIQISPLHNIYYWKYCPKATFVDRIVIETAVSFAVCQFSTGAACHSTLCEILGIEPGFYLEKASNNAKRIKNSFKASTEVVKKMRKELKYSKTTQEQKKKGTEGITYAAGSFDIPK